MLLSWQIDQGVYENTIRWEGEDRHNLKVLSLLRSEADK